MITIVSGMARSGTSLTMQMLKSAGFPIFWNRMPNFGPANPKGYYEVNYRDWRECENIEGLLAQMEGKATKVFPRNWDYFTPSHEYQIIYLDRNPINIRDSQIRMLELEQRPNEKGDPEEHLRGVMAYRRRALRMVKDYRHVVCQYEDLYNGSAQYQIAQFLGMNEAQQIQMEQCVEDGLHHFKPEVKHGITSISVASSFGV
jgi:hypothetical protein